MWLPPNAAGRCRICANTGRRGNVHGGDDATSGGIAGTGKTVAAGIAGGGKTVGAGAAAARARHPRAPGALALLLENKRRLRSLGTPMLQRLLDACFETAAEPPYQSSDSVLDDDVDVLLGSWCGI